MYSIPYNYIKENTKDIMQYLFMMGYNKDNKLLYKEFNKYMKTIHNQLTKYSSCKTKYESELNPDNIKCIFTNKKFGISFTLPFKEYVQYTINISDQ